MCNCNARAPVINIKGVFSPWEQMPSSWHYCCGPCLLDGTAHGGHLCAGWVSSLCHSSTGSLNILPVFCILEHHQILSAFFGSSWSCQHCLTPASCCMDQGTQQSREEHLSLITAKLLVCLQQSHACKFPHTEHLSLASVVGNHQKHSKTVTQTQPWGEQLQLPSNWRYARTGISAESKELPEAGCVTATPAPSLHFFPGVFLLSASSSLIY